MKSIFIATLFLLQSLTAHSADSLKVGDKAPDLSLPYATKDTIGLDGLSLRQFIGKQNIVLAFYPADWSGGCTKEVCTIRDNFTAFSELNAEVLAISGDYPYSHHQWAKYQNLPFTLLSDHKHEVAQEYNSYNKDSGYNHRTVFLIDKQGRIAYIDLHYSVRDMDSFNRLRSALKNLP
jgi:peroxiredoxin